MDNLDTAHAWINQVLDPQANAEAAIYLVAGVTVEAARRCSTRRPQPCTTIRRRVVLRLGAFYNNPPVESDEYLTIGQWQERWQELKASAA